MIDLKKLEERLDALIASETEESYNDYVNAKQQAEKIMQGLKEAEQIRKGELPAKTLDDVFNNNHMERISYQISNGQYCAHSVNMPLIVQAGSMEEMKTKIRELTEVYIKNLQDTLDNDRFEYVESELPH